MKLIDSEYTFDRNKLLFYFTADGRIDFRELVKDLASVFHTRIELRQIGVRDETKMLGGIAICGRPLCCHSYLSDFVPVSIKMAKEQNLSLNPAKISGVCGRLMCCLKNEQEAMDFVDIADYSKFLPKKLSGGLLRRLNIACGIAHKPKLIFFDEPTVAVDPQSRNKILEGIKKLNHDGATIIYTSHYMEEVEQLCDRILIMDKGKALALGTKDELKRMIKNTETINVEIADLSEAQLDSLKQLHNAYQVSFENGQLRIYFSGGRHNIIHVLDYLEQNNL